MTKVLLLTSNRETLSSVSAVLSELNGFNTPLVLTSASQARVELQRQDIDIILVDEGVEGEQGLTVLREISVLAPLTPACLLSVRTDSELMIRAIDAGARAILPLPPSVERYAERLRSLTAWAQAAGGQIESERQSLNRQAVGRTVAVFGAKGGVGTSMIALAAARSVSLKSATAVLDFDLRKGDLASYCGVRARHSLVDLVSVASELGSRELAEVAYPVRSGMDLFPAPEHTENGEEMTEAESNQILQAMRYNYNHIIVDCGSRIDGATAAVLDLADVIVVVSTPEVPSLRAVRRFKETLVRLELARNTPVYVVLNRISRYNEIQPSSASKLIDSALISTMPDSSSRIESAINSGDLLNLDFAPMMNVGRDIAGLLGSEADLSHQADDGYAEKDKHSSENVPGRRWFRRKRKKSKRPSESFPPARMQAHQTQAKMVGHLAGKSIDSNFETNFEGRQSELQQGKRVILTEATSRSSGPSLPPRVPPSSRPQAHDVRSVRNEEWLRDGRSLASSNEARSEQRRSKRREEGATAVEFAGTFIIATGLFVLFVELLLFAGVSLIAHNTAQEAARDYSIGMSDRQVMKSVSRNVPQSLVSGLKVTPISGDKVKVTIDAPALPPGMRTAESTAQIQWER